MIHPKSSLFLIDEHCESESHFLKGDAHWQVRKGDLCWDAKAKQLNPSARTAALHGRLPLQK